jgi:hypothetical protein
MEGTIGNHGSVVGQGRGMVQQRVSIVLPRDQGEVGLLREPSLPWIQEGNSTGRRFHSILF